MKITKKNLQNMINEELKSVIAESEGMYRNPMSASGETVDQAQLFDKIKDNLTKAVWLLENEEEMSRDAVILIDGALRWAMELAGMDSQSLPFLDVPKGP